MSDRLVTVIERLGSIEEVMILHPFPLSCSVQLASHVDVLRGSSRVPVPCVTSQKNVSMGRLVSSKMKKTAALKLLRIWPAEAWVVGS